MRKHTETLVPRFDYYISFNGQFLRIKGREIRVKDKVTILPWKEN